MLLHIPCNDNNGLVFASLLVQLRVSFENVNQTRRHRMLKSTQGQLVLVKYHQKVRLLGAIYLEGRVRALVHERIILIGCNLVEVWADVQTTSLRGGNRLREAEERGAENSDALLVQLRRGGHGGAGRGYLDCVSVSSDAHVFKGAIESITCFQDFLFAVDTRGRNLHQHAIRDVL